MRKFYFLLLTVLCTTISNAQLTGTKTIPGDYPSLAAAITDLNLQGVGAGGVILNLLAGNPQTAPAGGYAITATGSAATPIIIQGNANTITASAALVAGDLNDAIFKLIGADYITITGFTMLENAANNITAAATNNMTEWGVALLYATPTNGAQNNTIQNSTIDLDRFYQNTFGIYSNSTHTATAVSTSATATSTAGGNSGLKIVNNTITDINIGIVVVGPTAAADHNDGLDIGGPGAPTGNMINNYGTTGTFSGYANVSGTVNGILVRNTRNFNIANNTITSSNGGTTAGTLRGIFVPAFSATPTGTISNTVSNNTISVRSGLATGSLQGIILEGTTANNTTTLSINNNTFSNISHTVAASGAITLLSNLGVALHTTISNNTFNNLSVNTTGSVTFISNSWSNLAAGGTKNVNSNSIVTAFNKTGAGGTVTLFTDNGSDASGLINNSNNNNFSNISVTGATTIAGWSNTNGGTPIKQVTGNTFSNWTGGTSAVTGLAVSFSGSSTVMNNLVSNINSGGAITGITSGSGTLENFIQNTVHSLNSTGASVVSGMSNTGGTTKLFQRNKIYNLESNNAGGSVNGILISSGTTVTLQNNLIGDLRTPLANAANPLNGINITGGTTVNAYFNTVYLNAASAGALFGSSAISVSSTPAVTLRNNIFVNQSTPIGATGFTIAYRRSTTTLTNYNNLSNNNLFFAGTPGANNLIFFDGTNADQTLAAYKARVSPRDNNSVTENPPFLSTSGASANFLHINTAIPTQVESAATTITGITDDYDGDIRSISLPDIGADEGNFMILDLSGPVITYTPLTNTLCIANRTISATITDLSGLNTAPGTKPRVWFKNSTNSNSLPATNTNTTDGWKFAEATNATNPFSFTLDNNLIFGGVAAGDIIQYFIVAQDMAATPNVGINSGVFTGTPTSVALAVGNFPITGTINSFTIGSGGLSGSVTIGAAGTYPTLSGAGGLFAAINGSGLTGNLTANILDASVTETGATALNQMVYGCGGPFTLLIKPGSGVTSTLTGSLASGALIKILSSNVTIDGSNNGSTSRDLTITNTSATTPSVLLFGSTGTIPIVSSGIRNSIIINGANTATALVVSDAALGTAGYFNNITIQNNSIQKAYIGNYNIAVPTPGNGTGLHINSNDLNTAGANAIRFTGVYVQGVDGATVSGNNIGNFDAATAENDAGIWLATSTMNSTVSGNTITNLSYTGTSGNAPIGINLSPNLTTAANLIISNNTITGITTSGTGTASGINLAAFPHIGTTISGNKITNVKNTNTGGFGSNGIFLGSTSVNNNIAVHNNFIADIAAFGFALTGPGDNGYGIIITGGAGYAIHHNTIHLNTNQTAVGGLPAALNVTSGVSATGAINLRNNVFVNSQTLGTNRYAILSSAPNTVFAAIDFNDYFSAGPNLGYIGTDRADLAAIQAGFGGNLNSINFLPTFISATDLHLVNSPGANWCLNGSGTPIAGITTDIDNDPRSTGTPPNGPDMGADEVEVIGLVITNPVAICPGSTTDLTAAAITAGSVGGLTFTYFTDIAATIPVATPTAVSAGTYYIKASNGTCFLVKPVVVSLLTAPTTFNVTGGGGYCPGGAGVPVGLSGSQTGVNYQLVLNGVTNVGAPVPGTNLALSFGNQSAVGTYTVVGTSTVSTCTSTMTGSVTVSINPLPTISGTVTEPTTCVATDGAITLTIGGATGPYIFAWTGTGVNPTTQNQTNLGVGLYNVTVTAANGCSSSSLFTLNGPGGCAVCPTVPTLTTNPTPTICAGSNTTLTASGLTGMGITYGITFKRSTVALADPYAGGTVIATIPNAGLTSGGTVATTSTATIAAGSYFLYAVLSPAPLDPLCRPSAVTNLTVNPIPTVNTVTNQTVCNGASTTAITFSGAVAGTVFNWTNNSTSIGLGASGAGNIASFVATNAGTSPVTATITVTPSYTNAGTTCTGTPTTFTITVNPIPSVTAVTNQTVCNGAATAAITFSGAVAGAVYNWTNNTTSIGLGASGSGNIASFVATNTGTAPVTATVTVTPSFTNGGTTCTGTPTSFTITVNPTPTAAATANQALCNGASTTAITFTGAVAGTVFNWTNNTTSIGLAASGSGNIASFVATNAGTAPVTATITVTPSFTNGGTTCTGTPSSFTITVNPIPTVNTVANQTVCTGASTTAITFSGAVTGTVYNWTNNTTSIGLGASGTGNIASFVAANSGTAPVTATITVTPTYTNAGTTCTGIPVTFTITVNPRPTVSAITNQAVCAGTSTAAITFGGAVTGTVFNWTNNTTSIGLAASGSGNIASFVAANAGTTAVVATITVTPSYTNAGTTCTGTAVTFTITVNPQPAVTVTALANRICLTDTLIPLIGLPVGGSWSGIGVSGFNFIPSATAIGSYTLTYTYTNAGGCSATATTVARVEDCVERERLLDDNAVIIYPNPNNGRFNIKINSTLYNYLGMKVYNMYGQLVTGTIINKVLTSTVFNGLVFGRVIPVDLTHLPAGPYIVKLYYDNGVMTAEKGFKVIIAGH